MIRVELPAHLRTLAGVRGEVCVSVEGVVSARGVLDAVEAAYPVLRGTIREYGTLRRRAFLRFFVCGEDWSHCDVELELPEQVRMGREAFLVVGAVAGGLGQNDKQKADSLRE